MSGLPFLKLTQGSISYLGHMCTGGGRGQRQGSLFPSLDLGIGLRSDFCSKCLYPLSHLTSSFPSLHTHFSFRLHCSSAMANSSLSYSTPGYVSVGLQRGRGRSPWQPIPLFSKLELWRRPSLCSRWPHTYLCVRNYVRNEGFPPLSFLTFQSWWLLIQKPAMHSRRKPQGTCHLWLVCSSCDTQSALVRAQLPSLRAVQHHRAGAESSFVDLNPVVSSPQQIPPEPAGSRPESW